MECLSTIREEDYSLSESVAEITDDQLVSQRNLNINNIHHFETIPSYSHVFEEYVMKNVPFILGKSATSSWKSTQDWVNHDGTPNLKFLRKNFGETRVPVANCQEKKYSAQPKTDMTLCEYLQYWESYIHSGYSPSMDNLYLKDWHFTRHFPEYEAYQTPVYFTSDWLNEFWDTQSDDDDYRFVYMGPKGSWTPFHADVLRSYSWSANICGKKKWILFPPGEEEKLKDKLGHLVYDVDSPDLMNGEKYPNYSSVKGRQVVIQEAGEIIYVPSGWHHQVYNMEDTISINHNWINGCNIDISWTFLRMNLDEVQREIYDCLGMEAWDSQCQLILKASSGTDFSEFYNFIFKIAKTRLKALARHTCYCIDNASKLNCTAKVCKDNAISDNVHTEDITKNGIEPKDAFMMHTNQDIAETNDRKIYHRANTKENKNIMHTIDIVEFQDHRIVNTCACGADSEEKNNMHTKDIVEFQEQRIVNTCDADTEEWNDMHTKDIVEFLDQKIVNACGTDLEERNNMHTKNDAEFKDAKSHQNSCSAVMTSTEALETNKLHAKEKDADSYKNSCRMSNNVSSVLSKQQVLFDINRLKSALVKMMKDKDFTCLDVSNFTTSPTDLLIKLQHAT